MFIERNQARKNLSCSAIRDLHFHFISEKQMNTINICIYNENKKMPKPVRVKNKITKTHNSKQFNKANWLQIATDTKPN